MQWAYQPSLALGGDLFQVSQWGPDTLGLYILDASGHGVAAALRAIALMSFLREDNLAKAVGSYDPGAIINEANRRFPLTQEGEYFTLWVGRLHLPSRHAGLCSGRPQRGIRALRRRHIPMAVRLPAFHWDSTRKRHSKPAAPQLHLHDRLYLLSDGIYEAPSPTGELWGRTRLQRHLETKRHHGLENSIRRNDDDGSAMAGRRHVSRRCGAGRIGSAGGGHPGSGARHDGDPHRQWICRQPWIASMAITNCF